MAKVSVPASLAGSSLFGERKLLDNAFEEIARLFKELLLFSTAIAKYLRFGT